MTETKMILMLAVFTALAIFLDAGGWQERWCATYDLCEPVAMADVESDVEEL